MVKKFLFLTMFFSVLLCVFIMEINSQAETEKKTGYAGTDTCSLCHEKNYESYTKSSHGVKTDSRTPAAKDGCETCHGPGAAHADAGGGKGVGGIIPLDPKSSTPVEKINATCLQCHERFPVNSKLSRVNWKGSVHETRGLACTNCHSVHAGYPKNLSKPTQPEVCTQCHKQIKAQLQRQSHHPIREGKVTCTDCHNPHGTVTEKLLSANSVNEKCYECHAEKRGPFLWEHAPVAENCLNCHTPHGSSHDKLLISKRPYLCQTCHSNSRHPGTLYGLSTTQTDLSVYKTNSRLYYRACSNCHSQIHGSNHPSGKSLAR